MAGWNPKIWNRGLSRASLMGHEPTFNPSPGAAFLLRLGTKAPKLYSQSVARRLVSKKKTRTLNPVAAAAALSVLKNLLKLPKFLKTPSEKRAAAVAPALVGSAVAGNLTAVKAIQERSTFGIARERAVWQNALAQIPPELQALARKHATSIPGVDHKGPETAAQTAMERAFTVPSAGGAAGISGSAGGVDQRVLQAGTSVATALGKQLISRATRAPSRRGRRPRQVTRYDPETGDKYRVPSDSPEGLQWPSRKPSLRNLGLGGAAAGAGTVAKAGGLAGAGAGAVAGVVIGGLAVGLLIGTGLRKLFGTAKAVRAEEAAVKGALVLRQTRAQLEAQLGRKLTATETRAMFDEYETQLIELGFVQKPDGQWHRPRSAIERILG